MFASPLPMHIPDGLLSTPVALLFWLLSAALIGVALRRVGRDLGERQVPLMGVLAAAVFAGQMLNFSVAGGTSGHLLGAALATILLGPWAAIIVMTTVVGVQALVFQDGGLLVLGANLFNMAVLGVAVSHFVFSSANRLAAGRSAGLIAAGGLAAWASTVAAALACALELALSGKAPAALAIPAMGGVHALIGIGEALITGAALSFLLASRKELLQRGAGPAPHSSRGIWAAGLALTLLLVILSPLASTHPDGLEWAAVRLGLQPNPGAARFSLLPDYLIPGIPDERLATIAAGLLGAAIVGAVALLAARLRRKQPAPADPAGSRQGD